MSSRRLDIIILLLGIILTLHTFLEMENMEKLHMKMLHALKDCLDIAESDINSIEEKNSGPSPFSYDVREDYTRRVAGKEFILITVYVKESLLLHRVSSMTDNTQITRRHKMIRDTLAGYDKLGDSWFTGSDVKVSFVIEQDEHHDKLQPIYSYHYRTNNNKLQ